MTVQAGDVLWCVDPGDWFSAAIRKVTGSAWSHNALVLSGGDYPDFTILQVGCTLQEVKIGSLPYQWMARRPLKAGQPISGADGALIASDTVAWLTATGAMGGLYPWWKLPVYLLPEEERNKLLGEQPNQVCSATTARALISHGIPLYAAWENPPTRPITLDEAIDLSPKDMRAATPDWPLVDNSPGAPVTSS